MRHAGFVLVGGRSLRMGRDKALLAWRGIPLAQHVAQTVSGVTDTVTLLGDPVRYGSLGYPVCMDRFVGCGPIGGVATALGVSPAEWALVVGCDMPFVSAEVLRRLLDETQTRGFDCVLPAGEAGPEPLCGVYHRAGLAVIENAIAEGRLKMRSVVRELRTRLVTGLDPTCFANLNTPEEFEASSKR